MVHQQAADLDRLSQSLRSILLQAYALGLFHGDRRELRHRGEKGKLGLADRNPFKRVHRNRHLSTLLIGAAERQNDDGSIPTQAGILFVGEKLLAHLRVLDNDRLVGLDHPHGGALLEVPGGWWIDYPV